MPDVIKTFKFKDVINIKQGDYLIIDCKGKIYLAEPYFKKHNIYKKNKNAQK